MVSLFNCITDTHHWPLAALGVVICFLGCLTTANLLQRARETDGYRCALWTFGAGTAGGCGVWATHFISMLAYDPGLPVTYDLVPTELSLLIAIASAVGAFIVVVLLPRLAGALAGGLLLGLGIAAMHYVGMSGLRISADLVWRPEFVGLSIVLSIACSVAALSIRARMGGLLLTAVAGLLALAILSHHFIGMGAVGLIPQSLDAVDASALSSTMLALTVAGVSSALLGIGLISAVTDSRLVSATQEFGSRVGHLDRTSREMLAVADARLREQHVRLESAINNMTQGLCMFDAQARLVLCNSRYIEMYGLSRDVVKPGITLRQLIAHRKARGCYVGDEEAYVAGVHAAIAKSQTFGKRSELPDGRIIVLVNKPMLGGGWVATHEDVTHQRRAEERIAYLAHHDTLTDLPNRSAFSEHLAARAVAAEGEGRELAVLSIDLDRFNEVNDVFGHAIGDSLLRQAAGRLSATAGEGFLARLGGDEFALLIEADGTAAAAVAERIQQGFCPDFEVEAHRMRVRLSIGIATFPQDGADGVALLANADAALYRAKAQGRDNYRFFEAEMDMRLRERRALQQELCQAVENNELCIHYQPQAKVDGAIIGFEALVRWQHPTRGLIPPGTFIPIAEESGLITQIGEWILRAACREAASWRRPLRIAVNLSPLQFEHGDLVALVQATLLETGLAPHRLELEVTEGVLISDFPRGVSVLRRLKSLGVRVAMDDFGTGYASLSYLQAFPFDKIKIDRMFISNLESNPQSRAIVRAVIGLAQGLSLPVLAEGVETQEQLDFLAQESCNEVQGFLIGRPLPIADYAGIIDGWPQLRAVA